MKTRSRFLLPASYDEMDYQDAKNMADTLTRLFEGNIRQKSQNGSSKNDYAGYVLENNFYGQSAENAAKSLSLLANIAFGCETLDLQERAETLEYCISKLRDIYNTALDYINHELDKDSVCYRVADMSAALTTAGHGLVKSRQLHRKLLPSRN